MKKFYAGFLTIFLIGSSASTAFAQSSVTLYGSIDEGVGYVTNAKGSAQTVMGPISVPDQFGFKGVEDLGGGTKAIFQLENGFFSNTGALASAGTLFSRKAFVGLSDNRWGTLTLGKQWDLTDDVLLPNANGAVQYNYFLYHPANIDNDAVTTVNNTVKYASNPWHGVSARAMYGFTDASTGQGRYVGGALLYKSSALQLGAVYSDTRNKSYAFNTSLGYASFLGQNLAGGATFKARDTQIFGVAGTYTPNRQWAFHAVVDTVKIASDTDSARATTTELGVDWNITPFDTVLLGGYRTWFAGKNYTTAGLSNLYHLSVRTMLYAELTYEHAGGGAQAALLSLSPSSSSNQASVRVGVQHFF
ncbi:porin [Paraburkholderia sp. J41]|uniref:porin n=1 Tax=Paraburkholderia sp. J41 TaxID=2805433 RepID=UPI002AC33CB6|nr:porin [Paraburkholderia sp. J41]